MVELFIFDGHCLPEEFGCRRRQRIDSNLREVLKSINLPKPILIRTVIDEPKNYFMGIDKFLLHCLKNGNDRYESKWHGHIPLKRRTFERRGIQANDIIWAFELSDFSKAETYVEVDNNYSLQGSVSECTFIIDSKSYTREETFLYYQPNTKKRRVGLLGMVLFEVGLEKQPFLKRSLKFNLKKENIQMAVRKMKKEGYFQKNKNYD